MCLYKIFYSLLIAGLLAVSNAAFAAVYDFGNLGESLIGSMRFDFTPDPAGQAKGSFTGSSRDVVASVNSTNGSGLGVLTDIDFGTHFEQGDRNRPSDISTPVTIPVPEPETYAMILAGLGLIGFAARHRNK